jgi:hypothetical protein
VHDWQKEELARKTESARQSGRFPGKKFSAEFAVDMAVELSFGPGSEPYVESAPLRYHLLKSAGRLAGRHEED